MLNIFGNIFKDIFLFVGMIAPKSSFPKALTFEEEKALIAALNSGDRAARDKIIEHNLRLVAHIAKKYASPGRSMDDLISIGTIGLIKAVETFDAEKCRSIAGYASRCVENEILMFIRSEKKRANDVSLEEPIGTDRDGNEITLSDILSGDDGAIIDSISANGDNRILRNTIRSVLTEQEQQVIMLRYGLVGGIALPQREVGKKLHISRSYVSRIEKRALSKLNSCLSGKILP